MACARCGCGVHQTEDIISLNKIWHKCCFTCYKCKKVLDKCTAKIFQGEVFCECCYNCMLQELESLSSSSKPSRVASSPSCSYPTENGKPIKVLPPFDPCKKYQVCFQKQKSKGVKSCSCIPDRTSRLDKKDVYCFAFPLPREVANYYNRAQMVTRNKQDCCCCSEDPCCPNRPTHMKMRPPPCPFCHESPPSPPCPPPSCRPPPCCCRGPPPCPPAPCPPPKCAYPPPAPRCSAPQPPPKCCKPPPCTSPPPCCCCRPPPVECTVIQTACCPRCLLPPPCKPPRSSSRPKSSRHKKISPPCCSCETTKKHECCKKPMCPLHFNSNPCNCKMCKVRAVCTPVCNRCGYKVYAAEKISVSKGAYHTSCFSCLCCRKLLDVKSFYECCGEIFCKQCYNNIYGNHFYGFGSSQTC